MLTNLWLLAHMLFKVSLLTGLGPGFLAIAVWEFVCRGERRIHLVRTTSTSWAGVRRQRAYRDLQGADRPSLARSQP
jgi:hypothetical protein